MSRKQAWQCSGHEAWLVAVGSVCHCGGSTYHVDSDFMTGSVYAVCKRCGRWWPVGRTWIDLATGVGGVLAQSWWSKHLSVSIQSEGL